MPGMWEDPVNHEYENWFRETRQRVGPQIAPAIGVAGCFHR